MYILDYSINNNAKIDVMVYILDCSINNNAKIDVMVYILDYSIIDVHDVFVESGTVCTTFPSSFVQKTLWLLLIVFLSVNSFM